MKQLSVAALFFVLVFLTACTREKDDDMNRDYLGTWKLDKTIEEEYHPINTLSYRDEYTGLPGDSIVIKANGKMYSYEDGDPDSILGRYFPSYIATRAVKPGT